MEMSLRGLSLSSASPITSLPGFVRPSSCFSVEDTLATVTAALQRHDTCTLAHSQRVIHYARMLGLELGLSGDARRSLELGVFLHDLGKLRIPDYILQKPTTLTPTEWVIMRQHPVLGHHMLSEVPWIGSAAGIVLLHHERWDGRGYPFGLQGEEIPLGARICAVIDMLDALTSERPYRRPVGFDQACAYVASLRGTHFDPHVVDAFQTIAPWEWAALPLAPARGSEQLS